MKRLTCLLLIMVLLVSIALTLENIFASPVSGTISSDTVWTSANNPYVLTGTVYVPNNVTLTIQPGVIVFFCSYYLQVSGTLNACGTTANNIVFTTNGSNLYANQRIEFTSNSTSWDEQTDLGCIIENANFTGVSLAINASPKISNNNFNNNFYNPLTISGGSPLITNNFVNKSSAGIYAYGGSPVISNNSIAGNLTQTGIFAATNAFVSNNNITGCSFGIYASSGSTIQNNLVLNNYEGVYISGNALIQDNLVAGNYYGILNGGGTIQRNTITENSIGISFSTPTLITNNNIFGNIQYSIALITNVYLDATHNWWGTTDKLVINQTIFDSKSNPNLGNVSFIPFLTAAYPYAPTTQNIDLGPIPIPITHSFTPIIVSTSKPISTTEPTAAPNPTPLSTTIPAPQPTKSVDSALQTLAEFDTIGIAKIVLLILAIIWVVVIVFYVDQQFTSKKQ